MNTYQAPSDSGKYARTRELTAAFEFGVRFAGTADVETVVERFLEAADPQSYMYKVALRMAVRRGYNTKGGVTK